MGNSVLPPQAYTREILAKAYEWLAEQPASVRDLATTADNLVSLYFQSRRRQRADGNAPVSAETFKHDLKTIAKDLRQFEDDLPPTPGSVQMPLSAQPPHHHVHHAPVQQTQVHVHHHQPVPPNPPVGETKAPTPALDKKSHEMALDVQQKLNLSCEKEAVRLLIALGYDRVQEFLPRGR